MKLDFWKQRWNENQTGFHLDQVNPYLVNHWNDFGITPGARVFVPLCGKSLDMAWLADQGHRVLGVECSELAVESFFNEQQIEFSKIDLENFTKYTSNQVDILLGDYFDLDNSHLEDVGAVYDRASLVALPENMRGEYSIQLQSILPEGTGMLLVSLEYNQNLMEGPPFSVSSQEIRELYATSASIELIQQQDILPEQERFRQRGLDSLIESIYKIII